MPTDNAAPTAPHRILKISTCPSLSGRSDLTYHVSCNAEGEIYFQVVANSGSGQFNADSVSLHQVEQLLINHSLDLPMTSSALRPVFHGKSSNSPAFLFAALKAELLVLPEEDKDKGYLIGNIEAFKEAMSVLIAGTPNLDTFSTISPQSPKRKRGSKETA